MYENETAINYISFPIYRGHTVDPMLFFVDPGAPHSNIGDKTLEIIVRLSGRRSIPVIDSKHDFRFGDTLVRSRVMIELMLPAPGSTLDIPVILDVVDVEIPPLPGLEVLDGNNLFWSTTYPVIFGTV